MNTLRLLASFAVVGGILQILSPIWYHFLDANNASIVMGGGITDLLSMAFILVGLVAVYSSQKQTKINWTVSFIAAFLGTALLMATKWIHAFVEPALMQAAPDLLQAGPPPSPMGEAMFLTFALFAAGWIYFGISSLTIKTLPFAASILLIVAPLLDFLPFAAALAPAVWGAGIVWLGLSVLRVKAKVDFGPEPDPALVELSGGNK